MARLHSNLSTIPKGCRSPSGWPKECLGEVVASVYGRCRPPYKATFSACMSANPQRGPPSPPGVAALIPEPRIELRSLVARRTWEPRSLSQACYFVGGCAGGVSGLWTCSRGTNWIVFGAIEAVHRTDGALSFGHTLVDERTHRPHQDGRTRAVHQAPDIGHADVRLLSRLRHIVLITSTWGNRSAPLDSPSGQG